MHRSIRNLGGPAGSLLASMRHGSFTSQEGRECSHNGDATDGLQGVGSPHSTPRAGEPSTRGRG